MGGKLFCGAVSHPVFVYRIRAYKVAGSFRQLVHLDGDAVFGTFIGKILAFGIFFGGFPVTCRRYYPTNTFFCDFASPVICD